MSIQIIGYGGVVAEVDGSLYRALRITARPADYGLQGSYRMSLLTGNIALTATNGSIFQFGWSSPIATCLVWGVSVNYNGSSSASGFNKLSLFFDRRVLAFGSGGTLVSVPGTTGSSQQTRITMRPSMAGPVRISTTTVLTTGTWSEDPRAMGNYIFAINSTGVITSYFPFVRLFGNLEQQHPSPLVLVQNESLNLNVAVDSDSTLIAGVTIAWSEVGAY